MLRRERDMLHTPDGEIRVNYPSRSRKVDSRPKITIRLLETGLVRPNKKAPTSYGIFGDPGR